MQVICIGVSYCPGIFTLNPTDDVRLNTTFTLHITLTYDPLVVCFIPMVSGVPTSFPGYRS